MRVLVLDDEKITKLFLPSVISGAYALSLGDEKKYLNIEAAGDEWIAKSNGLINVVESETVLKKVKLHDCEYFHLQVVNDNFDYLMFCMPTLDETFKKLTVASDILTIGGDEDNSVIIKIEFLKGKKIRLEKNGKEAKITVDDDSVFVYVNEKRVKSANLKVGDSVFIYGVVIIWLGSFIEINNPVGIVTINKGFSAFRTDMHVDNTKYAPVDADADYSRESDEYFFHKPRLIQTVEMEEIEIEAPPEPQVQEELPWYLTIGTSFTMVAFAFVSVINMASSIVSGHASGLSIFASGLMSVSMIAGSLVFPSLMRRYNKKRMERRERERVNKYSAYLDKKKEEIANILENQTQILRASKVRIDDVYNYAMNGTQNIWSVGIKDDDFLAVRLGIGNVPSKIKINAPKEQFALSQDELKGQMFDLVNASRTLNDVPVTYTFTSSLVSAIITSEDVTTAFISSIILQLVTHHSPNDLKIVSLFNKNDAIIYNYLKYMPHSLSNYGDFRFFAENTVEAKSVINYLKQIYDSRANVLRNHVGGKTIDYKSFGTYYLILCDNYMNIRESELINSIIENEVNLGFSIVLIDKSMQRLPRFCENIISMDAQKGAVIRKTLNNQDLFVPEYDATLDMRRVGTHLMSIPVMNTDYRSSLPASISFLDMYKVSKIEQLNVIENWKNNNPVASLQAPVGVHTDGEAFYLDLHEKYQGPHGLIAGSTGSGKSEFIITYILSMCLQYHPNEVQFILIDYKGGSLAGAFYNEQMGIRVPHIAGVITDLDGTNMNRAIVSVTSELKRREKAFNAAKAMTGESTIDIYKYQKYYREGILNEPISHLFIVCDEFAELKTQQPDFMSNLISISRIGRSLGVHLILATQKPSGVVNDQIWSNSRFKVCLKVATRADSMELLKRPEAASLKEAGRFYLQVGYDEQFEIGQSGWSGAKYVPNDRIIKKHDDSVALIDNTGTSYKTVSDMNSNIQAVEYGDQLTNCVKYLTMIADKLELRNHKLWLDKIPAHILLSNLTEKYRSHHSVKAFHLNPIIGEYDHPSVQAQDILELDLDSKNTLIQGMATSGLDDILKTIIFSTCIEHTPEEVNFYIIDMGSETLRVFNRFPQVGDVCTIEDGDKILNMLIIGENEITRRKELFVDYAGDYKTYIEHSQNKLPTIIFVINYYDVFQENFGKIADALGTIIRDGPKYGVEFLITSNANAVRYKIQEYFQNKLCLQLGDVEHYRSILNAPRGLVPSPHLGRGLVPIRGEVLEFQTAFISERNNMNATIKKVADILSEKFANHAPNVPVIPKVVSLNMVKESVKSLSGLVIGYDVATKRELSFDITKERITSVVALDMRSHMNFIYALIEEIHTLPNVKVQIIDVDEFVDFNKLKLVELYNQNFDDAFARLYTDVTHPTQNTSCVYVITGIGKLKSKLNAASVSLYNSIFTYVDKLPKSYFLFVDDYESYKNLLAEPWYRKSVNTKNGIWIGDGVIMQIALDFDSLTNEQKKQSMNDIAFATTKNGENYVFKKVIMTQEDDDGQ